MVAVSGFESMLFQCSFRSLQQPLFIIVRKVKCESGSYRAPVIGGRVPVMSPRVRRCRGVGRSGLVTVG